MPKINDFECELTPLARRRRKFSRFDMLIIEFPFDFKHFGMEFLQHIVGCHKNCTYVKKIVPMTGPQNADIGTIFRKIVPI